MKTPNKILFFLFILCIQFQSCGILLEEYEDDETLPLPIDLKSCTIMNDLASLTVSVMENRSEISESALFDTLVLDSSYFITQSDSNNWEIPIDSICYFIIHAFEEDESNIISLNSSSEFNLFKNGTDLVLPYNGDINLKNIAGCPESRLRLEYKNLSGSYLARLVNLNTKSLKMVFLSYAGGNH